MFTPACPGKTPSYTIIAMEGIGITLIYELEITLVFPYNLKIKIRQV